MPNVWYIGLGDRQISTQDWQQAGITAATVIWSAENAWSVDQTTLTTQQVQLPGTEVICMSARRRIPGSALH